MTKDFSLILASSSPRRLQLLQSIGIEPAQIISPDINETRLAKEKPDELVARLAQQKALLVAKNLSGNNLVLGADTIIGTKARLFEKATNDDEVAKYLKFFSGRRIYVKTAVSLVKVENGIICQTATKISVSKLKFKCISPDELNLYIKSKLGIGMAGGLSIQGLGETLIQNIDGSYSGIVGLPLHETVNLLKGLGYDYFKGQS